MLLRVVPAIVISSVIVFYLLYNFFFSVNFPYQDDFLLIQFIEVVSQGGLGPIGLTKELFLTFNDHKAVIPRLISLIEYTITGQLNFRFYVVLILINLVYIFSFVLIQFRKTKLPLYYFLPVPFLFFHPLFHEVAGWAINGMQHTFLTAFTVTAILLISGRLPGNFYLAMVCCFCATFTHGNGILSFPAIVFYFLCVQDLRKAAMTCLFMFICLAIYLIGYESGQAMHLPTGVGSFLSSFFGFIGSEVSLWSYPELFSVAWGFVITAFMVYLMVKVAGRYFNSAIVVKPGTVELLSLFAFIVVTSLVIAVFRSWTGLTIASRFQLYAALSTVIFYVLLVEYVAFFRRKSVLAIAVSMSVLYWAYSHYQLTGIVAAKKTTYLADIYNWSTNRTMFSVEKSLIKNADFYLKPAYQKGFFHLPKPVVSEAQLDSCFSNNLVPKQEYKVVVENWRQEMIAMDGKDVLERYFISSNDAPKASSLLANRFLVLQSADLDEVHLMNANPKIEGRRNILKGSHYYKAGFNTVVREGDLTSGKYELGLLDVESDGRLTFYKLDKSLMVSDQSLVLID
jgi:hypothetical protein